MRAFMKRTNTNLPDDYWQTICDHLPNYHRRNDIAENDDLTKYVEEPLELSKEQTREFQKQFSSPTEAEAYLTKWDTELFIEALQAQKDKLLLASKCALADLEGIMPSHDPAGDGHSGWETIKELKEAIGE